MNEIEALDFMGGRVIKKSPKQHQRNREAFVVALSRAAFYHIQPNTHTYCPGSSRTDAAPTRPALEKQENATNVFKDIHTQNHTHTHTCTHARTPLHPCTHMSRVNYPQAPPLSPPAGGPMSPSRSRPFLTPQRIHLSSPQTAVS